MGAKNGCCEGCTLGPKKGCACLMAVAEKGCCPVGAQKACCTCWTTGTERDCDVVRSIEVE